MKTKLKSALLASICSLAPMGVALGGTFDIPSGDLQAALKAYSAQSGIPVVVSDATIQGVRTKGLKGELPAEEALSRILKGTGFKPSRDPSGVVAIVPGISSSDATGVQLQALQLAQASPPRAAVETVTVTSSKLGGADVQSIPIAITALSQEQLTSTQTAGGPDLVKQVPNLTFSKTNFSGYNIQIRGIGTQAISVTTDPAVAVALNDIPFIRNHFFEQEFYDLSQAEILRGPQGTLYGRNATAGVVNIVTAKPSDQFEAMASADFGNYQNRRFEGMINVPIIDDQLDVRVAGEWTKRKGYSFNALTNSPIDGRDLWSGRVTIGWKPLETVYATLVWEHFSEDDDRMRTAKQLCKNDPSLTSVAGVPAVDFGGPGDFQNPLNYLSQGCLPSSLYSADAFEVPNGRTLPYITAAKAAGSIDPGVDPYASTTQSTNLRVIESALNPKYQAKNDVVELNAEYDVTPALKLTSQTGYNQDFLWSTEDYNRFNTSPGLFAPGGDRGQVSADGGFCDPQLGCSNRLVAEDLSDEHASQLSQEFRLASNFSGPFNFSVGGNYLHYETEENYYVFINALTLYTLASFISPPPPYVPGVSDNHECLPGGFIYSDPSKGSEPLVNQCNYIDPNPIQHLNNEGHNYFLSQNPYTLNSYAGFGEVYYNVLSDLKLTGGVRWTDDQKHFTDIPSEVVTNGWGYPSTGVVDQQWKEWTGRFAANWTPKLDFTDQTLIYGSYAHGYKAGGANPPGAALLQVTGGDINLPQHPLTFRPEFIDAFELGTKNTLLDGALTLNGDVFYYDYKDYQISEIVDRTSINLNFNATVKGAELETTWEPMPGLKFSFAGGYEDARLANGSQAIDLIDRTAGNPAWMVLKPDVTQASNCILPVYVVAVLLTIPSNSENGSALTGACGTAYNAHTDPAGGPSSGYPGFDPVSPTAINNGAGPAPNNGEGFDKNLSRNQLPGAPHFTTSLSGDYTLPLSSDWVGTLHSDFYWQASSFARIFNDRPYDQIHGYTTVNFALIFTNQNGWQAMGYLKNAFNTTAITGDFLNSDDTGLTTNVFLTDPRLYGVRITKNF